MTTEEIATLQAYDLPEHISALDASLAANLKDDDADDLEYQFKVIYTLTSASKTKAHFQFVQPDSAEGKEILNVLIKYKLPDDLYPLKASEVVKAVAKKSDRTFTTDKHQRAWKMFKARPQNGASDPAATNKTYCIYHSSFKSYTYSLDWVEFLAAQIADDATWQKLCAFK